MINKREFTGYVDMMRKLVKQREQLENLGVSLDLLWDDFYYIMDLVVMSNFQEEAVDEFFAWFYGDSDGADEGEIFYDFDNPEHLWEYMSKHYNYEPNKETFSSY